MIKKTQKGFTLIELMIVVAIIGILAAVAIPSYQDYIVKAKLSKVVTVVDPIKLAIAAYVQEQGSYIAQTDPWTSLGLSGAPTDIAETNGIHVTSGTALTTPNTITIAMQAIKGTTIDGHTVTMTPTLTSTAMVWANTCDAAMDAIAVRFFKC